MMKNTTERSSFVFLPTPARKTTFVCLPPLPLFWHSHSPSEFRIHKFHLEAKILRRCGVDLAQVPQFCYSFVYSPGLGFRHAGRLFS